MNPWRADLHCHTTYSDGTLTPQELVSLAKTIGLQGLAITDHDNCRSYGRVQELAAKESIALLPGIELSTVFQGKSVHILGYGFIPGHPALEALCNRHQMRRLNRAKAILEKLRTFGIEISLDELPKQMVGRPHIAQAMIEKQKVGSVQEAFKEYLGQGAKAYVAGDEFLVEETLSVIHEAKGLAVLAHPHLIKDPVLVRKLLEYPFDGIECYYARFAMHQNRPWIDLAKSKSLLATGGSDFHGAIKEDLPLGASWVAEELFRPLWNHFKKHTT
jgi:predicted metal-dependent phosphoesterase TrpH